MDVLIENGRRILVYLFSFVLGLSVVSKKDFTVKETDCYLYLDELSTSTRSFGLTAPEDAVLVRDFSETYDDASDEYIVRYGTSDPFVAGVTEDGIITAVNEGEALIIASVELRNGDTKIFTKQVYVRSKR